jgi:hypothetical protein
LAKKAPVAEKAPKIEEQDFINQLEALKVEIVDIDWLKPNEYNPNRQTEDALPVLGERIPFAESLKNVR